MTVKIDGVEPNIFPDVEDLDARDAGRNVEVFLDIRVEGKPTPVTVKLSYEQACHRIFNQIYEAGALLLRGDIRQFQRLYRYDLPSNDPVQI
jgi:hypothetical protein